MPKTEYTLFDLPTNSTPPICWSPNTWKARGVLNYKGVPYETEWVEYPDIRVRLAAFGIPSKGGLMPYTLPMMRVTITPDDGGEPEIKYLTDSNDIAEYVNEKHPEPFMDFENAINDDSVKFLNNNLTDPFCGTVLCDVPAILPPRSAEYVLETRPKWMGMPVPDFKKKKIEEGAWENLEKGMGKLREYLTKNGGPFILGETVSFADVRIAGYMLWAKEGSEECWTKVKAWGGEEVENFMKAVAEKGITTRATY
ncbi:hypothetical protein H072_1761 [Dactylellina haptotyla CBS 200.50]|uniref:GST N-terminal domain-containing protein n=1 Tax=Dactylellina haptotyla (strain CBS 200.50) TaxID=1284197 RepID=S8C943_DACHA|nr:hypothetical protein H072_1761 [Dactylellina haptotyla CBS 200.50]